MCPQFSLETTDFIWLSSAFVKRNCSGQDTMFYKFDF